MVSAWRVGLVGLLCGAGLVAQAAEVTALRSWRAPDNTRLVLDISGPVQFRISPESTPAQLVLELDGSQTSLPPPTVHGGLVKSVRFENKGGALRLLVDLSAEVNPRAFQLAPNEKYGQRLVLDLFDKAAAPLVPEVAAAPAASAPAVVPVAVPATQASVSVAPAHVAAPAAVTVPVPMPLVGVTSTASLPPTLPAASVPARVASKPASVPIPPAVPLPPPVPVASAPVEPDENTDDTASNAPLPKGKHGRNIIIAIDAGHGGEDSGAIGLHGSYEKNVTLAIARDLVAQLRAQPGISAVLTRDGDYFIPLQDRRQIARYKDKADIFISIHADSSPSHDAKGASVFALSLKGANTATSRFARMLAERENRSDLIGGVAVEKDDNDSVLRNVLADMVVTGSLEHSLHMAHNILGNLDQIGRLHGKNVEQAGFAVLKEPGMVSLLVETGFISNPDEEARLTNPVHQHEIAHAIMGGALRYCQQYPAPGTYFAWAYDQQHGRPDKPASSKKAGHKKAQAGETLADDNVRVSQASKTSAN